MSKYNIIDEASKTAVIDLVRALDPARKWVVEVRRRTNKRTVSQNKWLWKCHKILADETGNDIDDVHEIIKEKFLEPKVVIFNNEEHVTRSTKRLTTIEWGDFMEKYYAFAASELGIRFPHPDDQGRD